jgi:hypothetical protein
MIAAISKNPIQVFLSILFYSIHLLKNVQDKRGYIERISRVYRGNIESKSILNPAPDTPDICHVLWLNAKKRAKLQNFFDNCNKTAHNLTIAKHLLQKKNFFLKKEQKYLHN